MATKKERAYKALRSKSAAVGLAFSAAFYAGDANRPDGYIANAEELDGLMGTEVVRESAGLGEVLRYDAASDAFAVVTVATPNETWTVEQLDAFLEKFDYLKFRVQELREARVAYEAIPE